MQERIVYETYHHIIQFVAKIQIFGNSWSHYYFSAQDLGIKQVGSFQCLNGKVDLSTFEAEHTLEAWEDQLERLRQERSVRAIAREISQTRSPLTVKVAAYLNGTGRTAQPELIFASSIPGVSFD